MKKSFLAFSLLLLFVPVIAQEEEADVEGSKDHPMLTRMPNYFIVDYADQEFSTYEFRMDPDSNQMKTVEGHYWRIEYTRKESAKAAAPLQIVRNYTSALARQGGVKVYEFANASSGGALVRLPVSGKNIWIEITPIWDGDKYSLNIVEEAGMRQDVEFTAGQLSQMLKEKGSVVLRGILFDTGKATIKAESEGILKEVAQALSEDESLNVEIQGHTDNVGSKPANLKLSQDRAAAVKAHLVKQGIADTRLTTQGFGDMKPVADNATEDGRAQNRRVELVRK